MQNASNHEVLEREQIDLDIIRQFEHYSTGRTAITNLDNIRLQEVLVRGCRSADGSASFQSHQLPVARPHPVPRQSERPLPVHPSIGRGQPKLPALLVSLCHVLLSNKSFSVYLFDSRYHLFFSLQKWLSHITFEKNKQKEQKTFFISNSSSKIMHDLCYKVSLLMSFFVIPLRSMFYTTTCKYIVTDAFIVISCFYFKENPRSKYYIKCKKSVGLERCSSARV